jgi:RimJ/RimL family protein N-acetyltransferase
MFTAPSVTGQRVRVDPAAPDDLTAMQELDWRRSSDPVMGGWVHRPALGPGPGTAVLRPIDGEVIVGALDVVELPGYPGVANVSIFTDMDRARGGMALEAYALVVDAAFAQGARLIHHEVLSLNRPIQRVLRGIGVEPSARLRDHAYVAGRWWDVLVFSYPEAHWRRVLERFPRNPLVPRATDQPTADGPPGQGGEESLS